MSDTAKLNVLLSKREQMFRKIQHLFDLTKSPGLTGSVKDKKAVDQFKVRYDQIDSVYAEYQDITERINLLKLSIKSDAAIDFQAITAFEDLYFPIKSFYNSLFFSKENVSDVEDSCSKDKPVQPRLPKILLPTFDGTLKHWTCFHDKFKSLIHDNRSINPVEKFHYLLSAVSGPALSVVRSLPLTETNYEIVWNSLLNKYQNKRVLGADLLDTLLSFKPINKESTTNFNDFLSTFKDSVTALKALEIQNLSEFIFCHLGLRCLPLETRKQFELQYNSKELPDFNTLTEFIQRQVHALEVSKSCDSHVKVRDVASSEKVFVQRSVSHSKRAFTATTLSSPMKKCLVCKSTSHSIYVCPEYTKMSPTQRKRTIRDARHCFNCLKNTHLLDSCPSSITCSLCSLRHHTSLHMTPDNSSSKINSLKHAPSETVTSSPNSSNNCSPASGLLSQSSMQNKSVLLGTAVVHIQNVQGSYLPVRALIDSGAQTSFITAACVQRLGLFTRKCDLPIAGLGHSLVSNVKGMTSCIIKPRISCNPLLKTEAVILSKITTEMPAFNIPANVCSNFNNLILADPNYDKPSSIDFLIAADLFPFLYDGQRILGSDGFPSALHSIFGWVITGEIRFSLSSLPVVVSHLSTSDYPIDEIFKRFWEIEEPPITKSILNPDDELCEDIYLRHHSRAVDGKYIVPLPFRDNNSKSIGDSYHHALTRWLSLERRFVKNPELAFGYHNFLKEYERLGHMTRVPSFVSTNKPVYFIPHHAVLKDSSSSTKLRVVFDGSSKPSNGNSLNNLLIPGPKLQGDIVDICSRFRLHKYVFTADISKMFRQIWIRKEDRIFQHILWRSHPDGPIEEFELNTVTYGLSPAPYLAQRTLRQLAHDEGSNYPLARNVITRDIYIDDILTGSDSLNTLHELKRSTVLLLSKGGFELRKWSSNSPELLSDLPSDHVETPLCLDAEGFEVVKVLGLQWTSSTDSFSYKVTLSDTLCSKRSILSHIARLYDPCGWLSPLIFRCKCLIQHLWRIGVGWDDPVPSYISHEWINYCEQLPYIEKVQISRYISQPDFTSACLVGFSDASEKGYSAVVYLVVHGCTITSSLVIAKSKVAPLKTLSIPRLELCGALLLSRLLKYLLNIFNALAISNVYAFTDSKNVLSWLKTSPHLLKTFVATRVSQIHDNISPSSWYHVSTNYNPADCSSRGLLPVQLVEHHLWWHGPSWLSSPINEWPIQDLVVNCSSDLPEMKNPSVICSFISSSDADSWDIIKQFSSFTKLQRVTAWCLRFKYNISRAKDQRRSGPLTCVELQLALSFLVKMVQQEYFSVDIQAINQGKTCNVTIQRLAPFLDSEGVLRVGGRLKHARLPESSIHPILLPKSGNFTQILIDFYHLKYLHVGPRALQSLIVRKYWILSARNAIRSRLSKCITCFKVTASPQYPLMGDLPLPRVIQGRPFINVGIDFGGPFYIKESKRRNAKRSKAYLALFICFASKAVHLELVSDLSTDAFLAAFDRFVSRRGLCHNVYTDCGTNFVGASRRLNEFYDFLNSSSRPIIDKLSQQNINWFFNVPHAPHTGGLWERGIRSTKHHLHRVLNDRALTYEEMSTLLAKIEAVLNSRPLCPLSNDPLEIDVLTPGHLLIGAPLLASPEENLIDVPDTHLDRWQNITKATQHFWDRWSREYLHTLQQRSKWFSTIPNLKVGDLVLLVEKTPPRKWRVGRVITVHPGEDDVVRVASVQTAEGTYLRPVVKLCPLPLS